MPILLDESLMNDVILSVQHTFRTMFNTDAVPSTPLWTHEHADPSDIGGVIDFMSERHEGIFSILFEKEAIFKLLSQIYRKDLADLNDLSVRAGVGEITNIVYGAIKASLNSRNHNLKMSIPKVITSDGYPGKEIAPLRALDIPFQMPCGRFRVAIRVPDSPL